MPRAGALAFLVLVVCVAIALAAPPAAGAQDVLPDAIPTAWHRQVHAEALLTAPPPPNPVTICVVDTGVTPTPDLDITARYAFDGGTLDDVTAKPGEPGHGTTVAHFAAAAVNGWGGAGIFPHARIASVRVFPEEGGAAWQDYIKSFDRCERLDPATRVILMSLGSQNIAPREAEELEDRIRLARRDGVNVVVAAGNSGGSTDFPGRFEASYTVAAVDGRGELCPSSARGTGIDLAAPGCRLEGVGWEGTRFLLDGTSYSAPLVAGVLAAWRAYHPALSAVDAESRLRNSAGSLSPFAVLSAGGLLPVAHTMSSEVPPVAASSTDANASTPRRNRTCTPLPDVRRVVFVIRRRARLIVRRLRIRGLVVQARYRGRVTRLVSAATVAPARHRTRLRVRIKSSCQTGRWTRVGSTQLTI
jgi:hypothetical protein